MTFRVDSEAGFFAEVEPAASAWLLWPGRTSRWWFEVSGPSDDLHCETAHYWKLDGGAFTSRRCLLRAFAAADKAWTESLIPLSAPKPEREGEE